MAKSFERQSFSDAPKAENEVYTLASLFAVHYMTIELANKLIVVVLAQQAGGGEISGGLMLPVYAANAYLVYFIQPWRRITVSFGTIVFERTVLLVRALFFFLSDNVI